MVGWVVGWLEKAEIKPTQPSWSWSLAELGNKTVGSLQPSRKDVYDKIFKLSPTFGRRKKMKILGASLYHSLQLVYTRNEKYSSLETSELYNEVTIYLRNISTI